MESNRSNVIGVVRDFTNPFVETPADAKFLGNDSHGSAIFSSPLFVTFTHL
jgi:hypothetical protein